MTTFDLVSLIESILEDSQDQTSRMILADALIDAGRDGEAALCRDLNTEVAVDDGKIIDLADALRQINEAFGETGTWGCAARYNPEEEAPWCLYDATGHEEWADCLADAIEKAENWGENIRHEDALQAAIWANEQETARERLEWEMSQLSDEERFPF